MNKPSGSNVLTAFVHDDTPDSCIIWRADVIPPGPNGSPGGKSDPVGCAVSLLTPAEETSINHGESTRFYPTDSEQFKTLYGRRNATESWHAELKRIRKRLPVRGMKMRSFYLCCLVVTENARNIERMRRAAPPPGVNAA